MENLAFLGKIKNYNFLLETNIEHICINDYGSGGIYFYKIEVEKDADIENAVFNLMELKDHYHKTCSWTGQSPEEFVDETQMPLQ